MRRRRDGGELHRRGPRGGRGGVQRVGRGGEVHPSPVFAPPPARDDPSPRRRAPGRRDRGGDAADARRARVPRGGHGRVRERPRGGPHRVQRRRVHRERAKLG